MAVSNIDKAFVLGGKAMFTTTNGKGNWFTFKVNASKDQPGFFKVTWFAGNDNSNEGSYLGLGMLDSTNMAFIPVTEPECPKCGDSKMLLRSNRLTGSKFFGCRRYPDCRGTRQYNELQETACNAFRFALLMVEGKIPADRYPGAEVLHCNRCRKCRKLLTTPESVKTGVGPECAGRKAIGPKRSRQKPLKGILEPALAIGPGSERL